MNKKETVCLTILSQRIHHKTGFVVTNTIYNTRTSFDSNSRESAIEEYHKQKALNHIPTSKKRMY